MNSEPRLNQIPTFWTVIRQAHADDDDEARAARGQLLERYRPAIQRYLLGAVRSPDVADELFQDFACRFLSGALRGADPNRGRFRDFVKGVLYHLVTDHHNKRKRSPLHLGTDNPEPGEDCSLAAERDAAFLSEWRNLLLSRTWAALQRHQEQTARPYFSLLRFRAENVTLTSAQIAELFIDPQGKKMNAAAIRKTLERARDCFSDLLLDEIAQAVDAPNRADLEEELCELGLLEQCRDALQRRFAPTAEESR
jgi:RNA polymerase sigma-70 factor (ECF subfamily)